MDVSVLLHHPVDNIPWPVTSTCLLCTLTCVLRVFGWVCQAILDFCRISIWGNFDAEHYQHTPSHGTLALDKFLTLPIGERPSFASKCQTGENARVERFPFSGYTQVFPFHDFFERQVLFPTTSNSFVDFFSIWLLSVIKCPKYTYSLTYSSFSLPVLFSFVCVNFKTSFLAFVCHVCF